MNEKITEDKVCKNCKYYVEHYVIHSTRLYAIAGHCINDKLYNPHKKIPERCAIIAHFGKAMKVLRAKGRKV